MIRFCPEAAARSSTSMVAIMVTAMPVTGASGLPALKVSTVSDCHGTPTCCWIRAITSLAVRRFSCAAAGLETKSTAIPHTEAHRATLLLVRICILFLCLLFSATSALFRSRKTDGALIRRQARRHRRTHVFVQDIPLFDGIL